MYRRYYDGYAKVRENCDNGEVVVPQCKDDTYDCEKNKRNQNEDICNQVQCRDKKGFLGLDCELDDLLLIGVLLFLVWDSENTDPVMLAIIGFIFLSEIL